MTTIAAIAAEAFTAVSAELTDVIKSCTVTRTTQGEYDADAGEYETTTSSQTGRALIDQSTPISDIFPAYVVGPKDTMIWLEGLATAPLENDTVTIGGTTRIITAVGDVVGAGGLFSVVAR